MRIVFTTPLLCLLLANSFHLSAQKTPSLAKRLGYPDSAKLLILHADDLGMAHAENQASFEALISGAVNSGSVMANCPWLPEVATFARGVKEADLGLHLTLTSEWLHYKWGPVASRDQVAGLTDSLGYFYDNCDSMAAHATLEEAERELRAQIDRAKALGIQLTHLDSHMGCLFFSKPELFDLYLRLGREYRLPVLLSRYLLERLPEAHRKAVTDKEIVLDYAYTATPEDFKGCMAAYYEKLLRALQPGVSSIQLHLAYDGAEMRGISFNHPDWGAAWRQADFNFFTSDECRKILNETGIQLVTWREIGRLMK